MPAIIINSTHLRVLHRWCTSWMQRRDGRPAGEAWLIKAGQADRRADPGCDTRNDGAQFSKIEDCPEQVSEDDRHLHEVGNPPSSSCAPAPHLSPLKQKWVAVFSLLVLRQTLLGENPAAEVEAAVSRSAKELCRLLEDHDADAGVREIIETLVAEGRQIQSRREVMAKVLAKSLQDGDGVFSKVVGAVYTAARGVVLVGGGAAGRGMAESALRRVGGAVLTDRLVEMSEELRVMAVVSGQVHRAWYDRLVRA